MLTSERLMLSLRRWKNLPARKIYFRTTHPQKVLLRYCPVSKFQFYLLSAEKIVKKLKAICRKKK